MSSCALAPGMRAPVISDGKADTVLGEITVTPIRDVIVEQTRAEDLGVEATLDHALYRVGPRDVLRITVWNFPQLVSVGKNEETPGFQVQADGSFYFPYAGRIQAQGLSVDEIRNRLSKLLQNIVKTPQISVSVMHYGSQRVYILGAVETPRVLPLEGYPVTIMEAIALAGGMTSHASTRKAYLLRNGRRHEIHLSSLLNDGDVKQNLVLQNGDVLHIPDNKDEKVYVLGAVKQPRSVYFTGGGLSLSEALVEGGGLDSLAADANNVYVIRSDAGKPHVFHLDMQYADSLLVGERFSMQPRDVIYVATAKVTQWNRVLNLIMPSVQSLFYIDALAR